MDKAYPIYKVRDTVDGVQSPGGFFAVVEEKDGKVKFIIMEKPGVMPDHAGTYTVDKSDFERMTERTPVSFSVVQSD